MSKREQLVDQARGVAHLAQQIANVHRELSSAYAATNSEGLIDIAGRRTASFLERLGDMLNEMDACSEDDEWVNPILENARQVWPPLPPHCWRCGVEMIQVSHDTWEYNCEHEPTSSL